MSRPEPVMGRLPTTELLESTHQFPCQYTFKAIGKAEGGFVARVVAAVREELGCADDPPFTLRQATGGGHVAVTLEPRMQTAVQVLAVYRRLLGTAGLVVLL
jgi:putative lipoic acid-binding regulatory protein